MDGARLGSAVLMQKLHGRSPHNPKTLLIRPDEV